MASFGTLLVLILALTAKISIQAGPEEWRTKSIYQVVTDRFARTDASTSAPCDPGLGHYCGGTWQGLIDHLDYIQGMGFSAVWISPVTRNLMEKSANLQSYHGYWQQDLHSVNTAFGTSSDLKDLADALHQRDMLLMVDVVVGNMAYAGHPSDVDYSVFRPFDREEYYHTYCPIPENATTSETRECWLGDTTITLPDLKTEDPTVARMLYEWISELVGNYSIDGLRIDSVTNVNPDFLPGLNAAAGVYCLGEAYDGNATSACGYQDVLDGFFNYPTYFSLTRAFQDPEASMSDLVKDIETERDSCRDVTTVATFSENHDVPRFASHTSDLSLAENALTFTMLYEGIPILYYGQEQNFDGSFNPVNREALWLSGYDTKAPLYQTTAKLNTLRSRAIDSSNSYLDSTSAPIYHDDHTLVLRKGSEGNQIITALTNVGASSDPYNVAIEGTGLKEGDVVEDILSCETFEAGSDGVLSIDFREGHPRVLYPTDDASKCPDESGQGYVDGNSKRDSSAVIWQSTPWILWSWSWAMTLLIQ